MAQYRLPMPMRVAFSVTLLHSLLARLRSGEERTIVELELRQQLAAYGHDRPRPRLAPFDLAFRVVLSRIRPRWKQHRVVVRPETVVRCLDGVFDVAGERGRSKLS